MSVEAKASHATVELGFFWIVRKLLFRSDFFYSDLERFEQVWVHNVWWSA